MRAGENTFDLKLTKFLQNIAVPFDAEYVEALSRLCKQKGYAVDKRNTIYILRAREKYTVYKDDSGTWLAWTNEQMV